MSGSVWPAVSLCQGQCGLQSVLCHGQCGLQSVLCQGHKDLVRVCGLQSVLCQGQCGLQSVLCQGQCGLQSVLCQGQCGLQSVCARVSVACSQSCVRVSVACSQSVPESVWPAVSLVLGSVRSVVSPVSGSEGPCQGVWSAVSMMRSKRATLSAAAVRLESPSLSTLAVNVSCRFACMSTRHASRRSGLLQIHAGVNSVTRLLSITSAAACCGRLISAVKACLPGPFLVS